MKTIKTGFFMLVVGFIMQSCTQKAFYDQTHDFKGNVWAKADTATFEVNVADTTLNHDFIISLRTSTSYLYSNLWIYILVTAPDGTTSKMAQKIPLANPDGSWIGRVSGTLVESRVRFDSKSFPLSGNYRFEFVNATQEDEIPFVNDIGLRIE